MKCHVNQRTIKKQKQFKQQQTPIRDGKVEMF